MSQTRNPGQSTGKAKAKRTDAAARAVRALELRLSGLGYAEIAAQLGYRDKSGAWRAVEGELRKVRHEQATKVVALDLTRLDVLLNSVWDKALAGNFAAFDRVLKVLERRAKYFALDGQAQATSELMMTRQELDYADALVRMAEIRERMQSQLAAASMIELSRATAGMPGYETPWEEAATRIEEFVDDREERM